MRLSHADCLNLSDYTVRDRTTNTIPRMTTIGSAIYASPPMIIPIMITGKNITVTTILDIPQAALTPNINNFLNTINIQIAKIMFNILNPFLSASAFRN